MDSPPRRPQWVGLSSRRFWRRPGRLANHREVENALYLRRSTSSNLKFKRRLYCVPGLRVSEKLDLVGLSDCAEAQAGKLPYALVS